MCSDDLEPTTLGNAVNQFPGVAEYSGYQDFLTWMQSLNLTETIGEK